MKIEDVIRKKGSGAVTITPTGTVADLVELLARHNIGAVVVTRDGLTIEGIVTERDVVRRLAIDGAAALARTIAEVMSTPVQTCTADDSLEQTAHTMTYSRVRHLPVVAEGQLAGIVSIGDVVKYRIDQLTDERNHLLEYLNT